MTTLPSTTRRSRVRALGAVFAVVMVLGGSAACSSDSDSKSADQTSEGTDSNSESSSDSNGGDSSAGRPDGFPDDIPLPEFTDVSTIMDGSGDTPGYWSIVLTIDPTLETSGDDIKAAYSAQLEEAGFEVDDPSASNIEANNDEWSISYHSAMDGTLTVGTSPN